MPNLKILCVHGLGDHRQSPWKAEWESTIRRSFPAQDAVQLEFAFYTYDHIFERVDVSPLEAISAVGKLMKSGVASILRPRARGAPLEKASHFLRWYAGYVVAWVEDEGFKRRTRAGFLSMVREFKPDLILAHSLGSLVTYDALSHPDAQKKESRSLIEKARYVTLGSQIGNAFVSGNLSHGRVQPLDVAWWYHLYNEEDAVFTAPIRLWEARNFTQVETYFDVDGWGDHSALHYLGHEATAAVVWSSLAREALQRLSPARRKKVAFTPVLGARGRVKRKPRRRALLIGINEYPNVEDRLEGCVNDAFLMSEVLQECGFQPEEIRLVLDDRATARGILERIAWLLDEPLPDDQLVLFYSGHGAQLPTYGEGDRVDKKDETLVPWDFDWSEETCVTDDQIYALYSQLPYKTRLVMIFDCCHSGGIHRGGPKAKGIEPPDDIRHRGMRWNPAIAMWEERDLREVNPAFSGDRETKRKFFGSGGETMRLGRGGIGRKDTGRQYSAAKRRRRGPVGPYLPLIVEACREDQLAYEYKHGVTSYGAFTYTLASTLRRTGRITYQTLVKRAAGQLDDLGYEQVPQILGPSAVMRSSVPWVYGRRKR